MLVPLDFILSFDLSGASFPPMRLIADACNILVETSEQLAIMLDHRCRPIIHNHGASVTPLEFACPHGPCHNTSYRFESACSVGPLGLNYYPIEAATTIRCRPQLIKLIMCTHILVSML